MFSEDSHLFLDGVNNMDSAGLSAGHVMRRTREIKPDESDEFVYKKLLHYTVAIISKSTTWVSGLVVFFPYPPTMMKGIRANGKN